MTRIFCFLLLDSLILAAYTASVVLQCQGASLGFWHAMVLFVFEPPAVALAMIVASVLAWDAFERRDGLTDAAWDESDELEEAEARTWTER